MRLINTDVLPAVRFHGYPEIEIVPSGENIESYKRGWNDAIDAIVETAPTIDAEPVKHGRWIEDEYGIPHCSKCGTINNTVYRSYCPSCGARMDEVEE